MCLDCRDADQLATFYSSLFGWQITARDGDWIQISDPSGGVGINIQAESWYQPPVWPEQPGEQAKMIHFEIQVDDIASAVAAAVDLGGREATRQPPDRDPTRLRVMLDPAGHPFCLWTT